MFSFAAVVWARHATLPPSRTRQTEALHDLCKPHKNHSKGWFTLPTESEAESESEAQGAFRSSVNQKTESEAESEARRNRSQKDQKSFFYFRFRRFRSSENKVNGIGSGSGQSINYVEVCVIFYFMHLGRRTSL